MFFSTMPAEVQAIMLSNATEWDCKDVYVGCSGNFSIEKALAPLERFKLHSNDVTLYSFCIGRYLSGCDFGLELTEDGYQKIPWVQEYMGSTVDRLATLLLMSGIVRYMDKRNPYYERMFNEYHHQFGDLHRATCERITRNETRIVDYFNGDAMDFIDACPDDQAFISYPPFNGAGKAYIRDFAKIEALFKFEPPAYQLFDEDVLLQYFEKMMKKKYWMFGTNMLLPDPMQPYLKAMSKTTNRGVNVYVYANTGATRYVGPRQETESLNITRLMPNDTIGDTISLAILSNTAFQTLRSEYMNINIRPGSATLAIGVLVDQKLVGVYAFSASPTMATWDTHIDTPTMYLLSDFPVDPTDYDRLAKLVLYAALSKESKMLAERLVKKRVRSLVTTAFSQNPVSMKYRGLFVVLNRKENTALQEGWATDIDPSNAYYKQRYSINYGAKMGQWTLAEGLLIWKDKHSQRSGKKVLA